MFEEKGEFCLFQEAQAALHNKETASEAVNVTDRSGLIRSGEPAPQKASGEIVEAEYVESEEEIDPYIRTIKQLHSSGDREGLMRYMESPQSERDFHEHMEIVGDRSMMEVLNHEAQEYGGPPPFDKAKAKKILKRNHETREQVRTAEEVDESASLDLKRLAELRRSLNLPPSPDETHLLKSEEQGKSEQSSN